MLQQELTHFGFDRGLKHLLSARANDLIQRTLVIKLGPKGQHFWIGVLYWIHASFCRNLPHGVLLVPLLGRW